MKPLANQVAVILDAVHAEKTQEIAQALADIDASGETRHAAAFDDLVATLCASSQAAAHYARLRDNAGKEADQLRIVVDSLARHVDQLRVALDTERACHATTKDELARVRASVSNALAAVVAP
jgi:hypothetical protein